MRLVALAIAILGAAAIVAPSSAETRSVVVSDVDFIVSEAGRGRILLKFPSLHGLENVAIAEAKLRIPVPTVAPEEGLEIRVHPITRSWTPGAVDWTTGWTRPGGDFHDEIYGNSEFKSAGGRLTSDVDVTTIVLEMIAGRETHGFILTVPQHRGEGFSDVNRERLVQALEGARLEIRYRNRILPPRLRRG